MTDAPDYELQRPDPPPVLPPQPRVAARWIVAAIVIAAGGAALWFYLRAPDAQPVASEPVASSPAAPPPAAARPLCAATEAPVLPPLDESDAAVGTLVRTVSSHPRVIAWLATGDLVRSVAVAVDNVAAGQVPVRSLRAFRPSGDFRVFETRNMLLIDPRSYARYASTAAAIDSVDAQDAARLCATLKPRLEDAYRELGRAEPFDRVLERAITTLLSTPVPPETVALVPKGAVYGFEDEALERLAPAQKQLLRMGPRHVRVIQDKLREIALAIGIPPERLPQ